MDLALRRLQTCHLARNCTECTPRGKVLVQATTAANPPITQSQRALLTAARRKVSQQGSSTEAQQVLPLELSGQLFRAQQLADSSPEEFDQLMAEHERQLRLRQQQQQHQLQQQLQQQAQLQQPRERRSRASTSHQGPPPQQQQQQQQQKQQQQQPPSTGSSAAPPDQLAQMRLLQQQLALRQVLLQQQQRKRQLLLQIRQEPAVLTDLIKRSTSWVRLQQLFSSFMPLFNPIHVSAAITHLAQLQERPLTPQQLAAAPQGLQDLVQELTAAVVACTPDFGPRQISNSLWAISRLGADGLLSRKLRNALLAAFVDKMPYAAPQHVAVMAAAVANMGWAHCAEWAQQLVQAAEVRMAYFRPQELAILLHALARLDAPLPAAWRSSFLAACLSNMHSLTLQELSMLAVSLVRLQVKPDQEWLAALLHAVQMQLSPAAAAAATACGAAGAWPQAGPGLYMLQQQQLYSAVSTGSSGSSMLGHSTAAAAGGAASPPPWEADSPPSQDDTEAEADGLAAAAAVQHSSADFTGVQGVVNILWALAKWQVVPPGAWQACCFAAIRATTRELTIQGVSTLLWSFAKLQLRPPQALLLRLVGHTRLRNLLPAANATDLAMLAWGLGSMGITAAALEAATATGPAGSMWEAADGVMLSSSGTSTSSSAGCKRGWGFHWLDDLLYHSFRVLPAASAGDLATLLVGAVKMRLNPGSQWLGLVLVEASHRLPTMTPQQLSSTLLSLARLRCQPADSFLQAYCSRSEQLLAATAAAGGRARLACRRSTQHDHQQQHADDVPQQQVEPPRERAVSGVEIAAAARAGSRFYTPQSLANTLGALAMLGYCPSRQWRTSFFAASAALLPCFTGRDFAYTIWALALLEAPPPRSWMDVYLVHLRRHVPTMTSQQLSTVIWALARLNHRPGVDWMNRFLDRVAALAPQASEPGSGDGSSGGASGSSGGASGGSGGASGSSGGASGGGGGTLGGMPAPPSPLQLSGYFSAIILQGLTGWACSCLDLGFDGSSGSGHTSTNSSSSSSSSGHGSSSSDDSSSGAGEQQSAAAGKRRVVRRVRPAAAPAAADVQDSSVSTGGADGSSSDAAGELCQEAAGVTHSGTVANDGSITFRF